MTKFQSYTFLLYNCKKKPACVYVLVRILVLSMHFLPEKTIYDNFSYCFISVSNTLICQGIFPKNCCKIYLFTYLFYSFVYIGSIWCHSGAIFIISLKSVKKWHFSYLFRTGNKKCSFDQANVLTLISFRYISNENIFFFFSKHALNASGKKNALKINQLFHVKHTKMVGSG